MDAFPAGTSVEHAGLALAAASFLDVGCGAGNSMRFAQAMMKAPGVGLDRSAEAVAACQAKGYQAIVADVLELEERSCVPAVFAIDTLPEVGGRRDFERAWVNVVRAARDFAVIQHQAFDYDDLLAAQGLLLPTSFAKPVQFKPRIADYIQLVATLGRSLNIVGLAIFGFGTASPVPTGLAGLDVSHLPLPALPRLHRSIRVVVARKDVSRFRNALQRAATGDALVMWEAEG